MRERIIRDFKDLIILKELSNGANMGGYDIITMFHRKFHIPLPPGSVYSMLYAMEEKGLVEGTVNDGKRVYKLTKKGEEKIQDILCNIDNILSLIRSMLGGKNLSKLL
jgi:DNA-binding PadR family transcriptional regulator